MKESIKSWSHQKAGQQQILFQFQNPSMLFEDLLKGLLLSLLITHILKFSDFLNRPQTTTGAGIDSNAKTKELQELRFSIGIILKKLKIMNEKADSPQFCLGQYRKLTRAHKKPRQRMKQHRPVTAPTSPLPALTPRPRSQMSM